MDNKAEFHNIQTELEELLVKYKNAFPKNLRQFLRSDLLIIPIIVTIIAIIACFNYSYLPLFILIPTLIITIYYVKFNDIGKRLTSERNNYKENLESIKQEINDIDISEVEDYPDVKNYLENYFSELEAVTNYKNKLANKYRDIRKIAIIIIGIIGAGCIFSIVGKEINNQKLQSNEKLQPQLMIATIQPADTIWQHHPIDIYLMDKEPAILAFKTSDLNNLSKYRIYRIAIVDRNGKPVSDIPYIDFINHNKPIAYSYPIANDVDNNIYEISKRINYLRTNANNLKYTVEELKWFR